MHKNYPIFDTSKIKLLPLAKRENDLSGNFFLPFKTPSETPPQGLVQAAQALQQAKELNASRIFLCGAHVLRSGVQPFLFDLMEKGYISAIAINGAGAIHDFELALIGATTESVARYIQNGQFGMWQETSRLNDIITEGWKNGLGIGEALGYELNHGSYPHVEKSLFAKAWQLNIPVTVHVGIGYDIIHAHPNFDGASAGAASYRDFLIFAKNLENLEHGCICTFGSAIMAPEVFLKALSMVRNVAEQEEKQINKFSSLVCDLHNMPDNTQAEPTKNDARYYFRPWKTLLSRTVAKHGQSWYVQGRHEHTIPLLWKALIND